VVAGPCNGWMHYKKYITLVLPQRFEHPSLTACDFLIPIALRVQQLGPTF
jgi:hypothetical protein